MYGVLLFQTIGIGEIVKVLCRLKVLQMHIVRKKNRLYVSIKMHNQIQRSRDLYTWVDDWWPLITWLSYYFYIYNNAAINFTISIKNRTTKELAKLEGLLSFFIPMKFIEGYTDTANLYPEEKCITPLTFVTCHSGYFFCKMILINTFWYLMAIDMILHWGYCIFILRRATFNVV